MPDDELFELDPEYLQRQSRPIGGGEVLSTDELPEKLAPMYAEALGLSETETQRLYKEETQRFWQLMDRYKEKRGQEDSTRGGKPPLQ